MLTLVHRGTHTGIITLLLPCYTAGKNAEAVGEDSILHAIAYMVPILNIFSRTTIRGKIRETKGIAGSTCDDCLTVTFSSIISLVQEARVSFRERRCNILCTD